MMRGRARSTRTRLTRLTLAAVLAIPFLVANVSLAAPSEEDVAQAKEQLRALEHDLEVIIERYNDAEYRLELAERRLSETKVMRDEAEARAAEARTRLTERAVEAYTGMGSQLGVLFEATDFGEFSDRLEFMGAIAQSDADLAAQADAAGQEAAWAAAEYEVAVEDAQARVDEMRANRGQIEDMLDQQEALYREINADYEDYMAAQRAASQQAAALEDQAAQNDGSDDPINSGPPDDGGGYVPPANASAAEIAVSAALSVLGTQYVWGGASPSGFDCSGLISWAWAQAGVYVPHSSEAQYSTLPRVPLSEMAPGDIIFFYSPTSHVGMYIGGGDMIHARHPGPGGEVQRTNVYAYHTPVGAVRPG